MGSTDFSNMVTNDASRANFVRTSVSFIKKHKFDGLGNYFLDKLRVICKLCKMIFLPKFRLGLGVSI